MLLSSVFPGNRLAICGRSQSDGISGTVRGLCRLPAKFPPSTILTERSQVDGVEKELGPSWGPNHLPKSYKLGANGLPPSHLGIPPSQIWGKTRGLKIFKKSSCPVTYSGFERQSQRGPELPNEGSWGQGRCSLCLICWFLLQVPSSVVHHISDSGLAVDGLSDVPYVRLESPPSFDNTTYTSLSLEPPSGKTPPTVPSSSTPLPPKVLISSNPVTYATVIFPGGDKGGGASWEPAQNPPDSKTPPS